MILSKHQTQRNINLKKGKNSSQEKKQEKLDDTLQDRDWNIKGVDTDTKKILQVSI